jgi:hypothetical protein
VLKSNRLAALSDCDSFSSEGKKEQAGAIYLTVHPLISSFLISFDEK